MVLKLVIGIITTALVVLLAATARFYPKTTPKHQLRGHLRRFSYAWGLLALYYWLTVVLVLLGFPADPDKWPLDASAPNWSYVYHLITLAVCWGTNIYLRDAISYVESATQVPDEASTTHSQPLMILARRFFRFLTESGILFSFLLSMCIVSYPLLASAALRDTPIMVGYLAQLIVSSALFIRLGLAYFQRTKAYSLTTIVIIYSLLQLYYPFRHLFRGPLIFLFILFVAKLFLAAAILLATKLMGDRLPRGESKDEILANLASRLDAGAKLRRMILLGGCAIATGVVALNSFWWYPGFFANLKARGWHPVSLGLIRLLWLGATLLTWQLLCYAVIKLAPMRVSWTRLTRGLLRGFVREDRGASRKGWSNITLSPVTDLSTTVNEPIQVILLHGIFSSGPRAWGMLPVILLNTGRVGQVHLLSYGHNLWSSAKLFSHVGVETQEILRSLVRGYVGQTVLFAHSLGGLLAMNFISNLDDQALMRKIKNCVFVAPPLHGSGAALFGLPYPWPRRLLRGSVYIDETVEALLRRFPPPGSIVGEESFRCSISFIRATRDELVGGRRPFRGLPGPVVQLSGWHTSVNAVYSTSGELVDAYLAELQRASPAARLMQLLASNLSGIREVRRRWVFEWVRGQELGDAVVLEERSPEWGETIPVWSNAASRGLLRDLMKEAFEEDGEELLDAAPKWIDFWSHLQINYSIGRQRRELIRMDWPAPGSTATMYLFATRKSGFAIVLEETLTELRGRWEIAAG